MNNVLSQDLLNQLVYLTSGWSEKLVGTSKCNFDLVRKRLPSIGGRARSICAAVFEHSYNNSITQMR
jgi:hypothetical protein